MLLRYTNIGIAIRASAERSDRASLLGVPVKRLQTVVWAMAALLSFIGVFLQAGILGLPVVTTLDLSVLLASLAALMLGKLTDLPSITLSAIALGLLEQGITWNNPRNPELVDPIFAAVIVICLLVRKMGTTRAEQDSASSWQTADEVRPVPHELRKLPEVRLVRWGGALVVVGLLAALPAVLGPGDKEKATALIIFCMITMSVVVLTGWAGQVSLGQMSFVGFGAATGAYATQTWHLDLGLALLFAGFIGAIVALLVGLPALRLRGLFLAVTTLAFSMATSAYFLNIEHFSWVPDPGTTLVRPKLFGLIDLGSQTTYYYLCLAFLALTAIAVRGIRHSRTGRVLLALRENERAAQSYGVNITRAKLTAFAISGFMAAVAGCLLVHLLTGFSPDTYSPYDSFSVFIAAVVGGVGSMLGAVLGAMFLKGGEWFLPGPQWQALRRARAVCCSCCGSSRGASATWSTGCVTQDCDGWPNAGASSCPAWSPMSARTRCRSRPPSRRSRRPRSRSPTRPSTSRWPRWHRRRRTPTAAATAPASRSDEGEKAPDGGSAPLTTPGRLT